MTSLPQAPPPDWRQYMLRAIIWVVFVGALGYSAANGGLDFLENDVALKLDANRSTVTLASVEPAVIELKVTLKNSTQKAVALSAPSACKVFRWQIFSRSGEMVQSKIADDKCPETPVSAGLASGQQLQEIYALALVTDRYKAGHDYQVRVWYWGYKSEFEFSAE